MFENFNKSFDSGFRAIFVTWFIFWGLSDLFRLIYQYGSFYSNTSATTNELLTWWLSTFGNIIALTIGLFLFFMMLNSGNRISEKKIVKGINTMQILAVCYYLFYTIFKILIEFYTSKQDPTRMLIFSSAWILPSIVLLIVHLAYLQNLDTYNKELEISDLAKVTPLSTSSQI